MKEKKKESFLKTLRRRRREADYRLITTTQTHLWRNGYFMFICGAPAPCVPSLGAAQYDGRCGEGAGVASSATAPHVIGRSPATPSQPPYSIPLHRSLKQVAISWWSPRCSTCTDIHKISQTLALWEIKIFIHLFVATIKMTPVIYLTQFYSMSIFTLQEKQ